MTHPVARFLVMCAAIVAFALPFPGSAIACEFDDSCEARLSDGAATVQAAGQRSEQFAAGAGVPAEEAPDYAWRSIDPCVLAGELGDSAGSCDSTNACPSQPDRVVAFLVVQRKPMVRPDGTAVVSVPPGLAPGDTIGDWSTVREGCMDVTALNPPPSPGEVFSYFQRLPLPQLATKHQPPDDGLSGLPVIFYTDSPTTQTFTLDVRGFTVVITAAAQRYTWHTGDPTTPTITSADPGRPYPDQTVEHSYRSGTYTALLTTTWGATFTVDGSAPTDVPGTTTTEGPPVTFDVLQARPVLTNPYD